MKETDSQSRSSILLPHPSIGRSPTGHLRVHVEVNPRAVGRLVGYDPRSLEAPRGRTKKGVAPANVSPHIAALQQRVQRSIDPARVAQMVRYLREAFEPHGKFADWGSIEIITSSLPDTTSLETHNAISLDIEAEYFVTDGQHRYCALLDFVREHPEFADRFTQGLELFVVPGDRLDEYAGQSFHDRNFLAQPVRLGKALSVDSRDPVNALARGLDAHPVVRAAGGVAYERDTLLAGDPRWTTHSVAHRFVRGFLFGRPGLDGRGTDLERDELGPTAEGDLGAYVTALGACLPWTGEAREEYLTRSSVVFSALAVVGHDLFHSGLSYAEIGDRIASLCRLDWRRTNLAWVGVLGSEKNGRVQPASSRPAIDGLIRFLRTHLGVTPGE